MTTPSISTRFTLLSGDAAELRQAFASDVRHGLTTSPKHLSCRYFYDREGSRLFERICTLPEYYLTRAETQILQKRAASIVDRFPQTHTVIELGSGSAVKTEILLGAFLRKNAGMLYCPIDLCEQALRQSSSRLLHRCPALCIVAVAAEYGSSFSLLEPHITSPKLILWLGSNIGNLDRGTAADFLNCLAVTLRPGDAVLMGIDLRKAPDVLERAYNDARGVTAEFNKNLLARINRELGGGFDLSYFDHRARYHRDEGRIEMHLVSSRSQRVCVRALDTTFTFEEGEAIHTEDSYKYSDEEIETLLTRSGLRSLARWYDDGQRFASLLLARV